jgi:hypothetical protein
MLRSILEWPRTLSIRSWASICCLLVWSTGLSTHTAFAQTPSPTELVAWLEHPETEWLATAHLQAVPDIALPLLLEPGRVASGHDRWTAHMLALAKLGERAIPAITARVTAILETRDAEVGGTHPLIKVLGSMGPAAVPALVQIAEQSPSPYVTVDALDEIVGLELRTHVFGQLLSPWLFWRPDDGRVDELRRELVPQLPRLQRLMERAVADWKPQGPPPQRAAAYLLARWGEGDVRARGLRVLEELAQADEPFYHNLESLRLLHALGSPETARLIRVVATRVPDTNDLRGQYLLRMAIGLHQLGDRDYGSLLSVALRDANPSARKDAARFVADISRSGLVARRVKAYLAVVRQVPIWEANRWFDEFDGSDGQILLPLIDRYLSRRDLDATALGPHTSLGGGGSGPIGMYGPRIVTLLLDMTMRQVPGALQRLTACLDAADPKVRIFGALALSAFDRPLAIERLAVEAKSPAKWHRSQASEFLLQLGDKRGIPARLEMLASDDEATRLFACRDLRVYTQAPLSCEPTASASDRAVNIRAWQAWWNGVESTFRVKTREAELDLAVFPLISPVPIGGRPVK